MKAEETKDAPLVDLTKFVKNVGQAHSDSITDILLSDGNWYAVVKGSFHLYKTSESVPYAQFDTFSGTVPKHFRCAGFRCSRPRWRVGPARCLTARPRWTMPSVEALALGYLERIAAALEKAATPVETDETAKAATLSGVHAAYADRLAEILDNEKMDTFNKYVQLRDLQSGAQSLAIKHQEEWEKLNGNS